MIKRIDHIGIAVSGLERRLPFWAEALGLEVGGMETVASEGVKVAFLPVGDARLELLEPLGEDTAVGRHVARRGEGVHHLTLETPDIERALAALRERGVEIVGEAPRAGAEGTRVAFVHPRSTGGVLVELVERPASTRARGGDIAPGEPVLAYLREPTEKLWGVLRRLDAAGVVVEAIDLGSFDDWMAQVERRETSVVGPSTMFVPMSRVERITLDCSSGELPSLAERFERRTGRSVLDVLGG